MDYELVSGKGVPIVFLHGFGGSKQSFMLAKNQLENPMLFLSFMGFGESGEPQAPYNLTNYADDLKSLIIELFKGQKVIIVCHSFGARVAAKLLSKFDLASKLIIVDGAGLKPRRSIKYYYKVWKYKRLKRKVQRGKLDSKVLEKYGSDDYRGLSKVMKQTFINVVNEYLENDFKKVKCETLIFWGTEDRVTPLYMAKKLNRLIKNSALIKIKGAGHFSYLDRADIFLAVLRAFV